MLDLYLSNKPSDLNKDIIFYFNHNLESIVRLGLYINFIVAEPKDASKYTSKGIVNFPTMIFKSKNIKKVGFEEIKDFFKEYKRLKKKNMNEKTDRDDINNYWQNILKEESEIDNEDNMGEEIKSKTQIAVQERQKKLSKSKGYKNSHNQENSYVSPSINKPTNKHIVKNSVSSFKSSAKTEDDKLMEDFFANRIGDDIFE